MKCAKILLEEAGASLADVCKVTIYITDRAYREPVYQEIGRWLKGVYPCSTGLIVNGLARPEWVMEIDVEAVIPAGEEGRRPITGPAWMAGTKGGRRGAKRVRRKS